MLAVEIGLNGAARKLGIPIPTVKSWARRGKWNVPKRKAGGPPRALPASIASNPHPVAAALSASHEELEDATRTGLMHALAKAAQQVGANDALRVDNAAQLQSLCLAAAKLFGWRGDASVQVNVDNRQVIITEAKRAELQEKLKRLQESAPAPSLPEPKSQTAQQSQPAARVIEATLVEETSATEQENDAPLMVWSAPEPEQERPEPMPWALPRRRGRW